MAIDSRKRARQLARKAAKRKAQLARRRAEPALNYSIADWPIHVSYAPSGILETGLGTVLVSRRMGGQVAAAVFLLDTGCLGAKNAFLSILGLSDFQRMVDHLRESEPIVPVTPEFARKLIEGAVAYAAGLGFKPHKDYHRAKSLFGAIDTARCGTEFEFGQDGKAFYCSGPSESPEKRREIIDRLTERLGPEGFHFMVGIGDNGPDDE